MSRETFSYFGELILSYLTLTDHYRGGVDPALPLAQWFLKRFPPADATHLKFDLLLIRQLLDEITGDNSDVARTVIPSYGLIDVWGYEEGGLPVGGDTNYYNVAFIHVPQANGDIPPLDQYIWLLHEIFHHIWTYLQRRFTRLYNPVYEAALLEIDLASLADRAVAKQKANMFREQFALMWQLGNTAGWPLELAIDTLCLYVSGPAYLSAFVAEHTTLEPFKIEPAHPPVELRAGALLAAATTLGWRAYTGELERLLESWRSREQEASLVNRYTALRSGPLMSVCAEAAVTLAKEFDFPRLTAAKLQRLERAMRVGSVFEGLDLVIAAQLFTHTLDDDALFAWEERSVKGVLGEDSLT